MAIKINFDQSHNPEQPTFILATQSGHKLGKLNALGVVFSDAFKDPSEFSFKVNKFVDGVKDNLWDKIVDFKLVWCKEYDMWYQITVDLDESTETIKSISGIKLSKAELGQIMLYNIEINTEDDIARDDYDKDYPTILFDSDKPERSLLHRIMEKAPHYKVVHVDSSIAKIQRTFSFDNTSIDDAFGSIEEEIGCLFVCDCNSKEDGKINREISVYDIQNICNECGYRGDFTTKCPECGSVDIGGGYGEDTTIFVTSDELADNISFTTDTGSVKNCFKLEAGDELITATIRNCNPNGSDYIWYISEELKSDMSDELVEKINSYDRLYNYYQNEYSYTVPSSTIITKYNNLVNKYRSYKESLELINMPIVGYPAIMTAYYNTIDLALYLESELMPDASLDNTSAEEQANRLNVTNIGTCAVQDASYISLATANSVVTSVARVIVDSRYQVKVKDSSLNGKIWRGNFVVTNYSNDEDTVDSETISITITDDYASFLKQKIQKAIGDSNSESTDNTSISGLFSMELATFKTEIKKYCLQRLISFYDACQACIDILIEQGVSDGDTWSGEDPNLYNDLYVPYTNKLGALESEIKLREDEIAIINGVMNDDGTIKTNGLQTYINNEKNSIQKSLNFEDYIGEDLWYEFVSYRREDKYTNDNYISDGLNNADVFAKAQEFITVAKNEIFKSAELQHSISSSLKNLLVMKKFEPLINYFEIGNWIRVMVDDVIYKLRLISYEIDFDDLNNISVEFSDVTKTVFGMSDQKALINKASSMASSYSSTQRQASKGSSAKDTLTGWVKEGLDTTNTKIIGGADNQTQTWDSHGMLFRRYNGITESYDDTQLKIINSTIAITDNNWKSTKTAIGQFYYRDPRTNELAMAYGINGEVIIGKILIGEQLGIYNDRATMTFDENGLMITNNVNTVTVNPNASSVFTIANAVEDVISMDSDGNGVFAGTVYARSGSFGRVNPFIIGDNGLDGSVSSTNNTSTVTINIQQDLYSDSSLINNVQISVGRENQSDAINDITLNANSAFLYVEYTYTKIVQVTSTTTIDSTSSGSSGNIDGDDYTEWTEDNSSSTTTTTTETKIIDASMNIEINGSFGAISVSFNDETKVKTYRATYAITNGTMSSYIRNLILSNNSDVNSSSTISIKVVELKLNYSYFFTGYTSFSHIGTDYFSYSNEITIQNGVVTLGQTIINSTLNVSGAVTIGMNQYITGSMASNDFWRILGGGSNDSGYLEIATADNGNEPIYIRQYSGKFATLTRTLTLLDASGNTTLPSKLFVGTNIGSTGTYIALQNETVIDATKLWMGYTSRTSERQIMFVNTGGSGTYPHYVYIYGGNINSTTAIGVWDGKNNRGVWSYNDASNVFSINTSTFYFKDYSGTTRMPIASISGNGSRVAVIGSKSTGLNVYGQWGKSGAAFSAKTIKFDSSDIRLKDNVLDCEIDSALNVISKIKLHSFDWNDRDKDKHQRIGFIADELEEIDSRFAFGGGYDKNGLMNVKCVDTFYMMGYVVKAIQELNSELDKVKRELKELKGE